MNPSKLSSELERLASALRPTISALAMRGSLRNYRKNSVVLNEGESGDCLYVLLQGRAKAFSTDANGREITYGMIEPGQYFGELSLDGGPRSASIITVEPSICSLVSRAVVIDHVLEEPQFALDLIAQVIQRARAATETARQMALLDVYGRVVAALESQYGIGSPDKPVTLTQITHQQIASRVGASREMVSRLLKDLERGGYVALGVKRITLKKKLPARW